MNRDTPCVTTIEKLQSLMVQWGFSDHPEDEAFTDWLSTRDNDPRFVAMAEPVQTEIPFAEEIRGADGAPMYFIEEPAGGFRQIDFKPQYLFASGTSEDEHKRLKEEFDAITERICRAHDPFLYSDHAPERGV